MQNNISVECFTFNPLYENSYLVIDNKSKEAWIIDPGCYEESEQQELVDAVEALGVNIVKVINTHCHFDHVFGNAFCCKQYDVKLAIHDKDLQTLRSVPIYAPNYGFPNYAPKEPDEFIEEGQILKLGEESFQVFFVPGHAPGHIALYHAPSNTCISGDVLFSQSIGRTDLPGGNYDQLISSIKTQLFPLPDDTVVYPGHGPTTTIGSEKKLNPFLK